MNPWPIYPLTSADLDFAVVSYDFSGLTANALADEPGLEAAIDLTLADVATSIADQTSLIAIMFDGLDDLDSIIGEIDGSPLDGVLGELANAATAGDSDLNDFTQQFTDSTPPPQPTPAPVLKVGGATGPVLACVARQGMGPGACTSYPCTTVVPFTNTSQQVLHVSSVTLVQRQSGPFSATTTIPATMQPGAQAQSEITIQGPIQQGDSAQLQIVTDGPGSPHVFCIDGGTGSGGGGGGGGGGPKTNPTA